ncbi:Zinc transporter ZupT [Marinibacterium anthonyi]|nr:Zinc transporter ZupT [Marinibacterium anthonyi]
METSPPVVLSFLGSFATCMLTALGAAPVLFGHIPSRSMRDSVLCVSVGVMLATLLVSMIFLALDGAKGLFEYGAAPAAIVCFAVFLGLSEVAQINQRIPSERLNPHSKTSDGATLCRVWIFIFAITVHNFPEGFALGIGIAADGMSGGIPLGIGIGLQNAAEGLAVAAALLGEGYSKHHAWLIAALTGLIEPVGGLFGAAMINSSVGYLQWGVALAAGATLFVSSHEIIPSSHRKGRQNRAVLGLAIGLVIMLFLDARLR